MTKLAQYNEQAFEVIPAGIYDVRLDNIEVTDKQPDFVKAGEDPQQWKWSWSINDGEQAGATFILWSNRTVNKGSTAKPWVEALLGHVLANGESVDTDDLLEKTMRVYLAVHTTQSGKIVNRIKDVLSGPPGSVPSGTNLNGTGLPPEGAKAVAPPPAMKTGKANEPRVYGPQEEIDF